LPRLAVEHGDLPKLGSSRPGIMRNLPDAGGARLGLAEGCLQAELQIFGGRHQAERVQRAENTGFRAWAGSRRARR
jgi:hypothetical protein